MGQTFLLTLGHHVWSYLLRESKGDEQVDDILLFTISSGWVLSPPYQND